MIDGFVSLAVLQLGDINTTQLGLQLGSGGVVGALIGFFAKKVAKVIAFLVGVELALFAFLESRGILSVDWNALSAGLIDAGEVATGQASWLMTLLSTMSVSAGFTGGFLLGFRRG